MVQRKGPSTVETFVHIFVFMGHSIYPLLPPRVPELGTFEDHVLQSGDLRHLKIFSEHKHRLRKGSIRSRRM